MENDDCDCGFHYQHGRTNRAKPLGIPGYDASKRFNEHCYPDTLQRKCGDQQKNRRGNLTKKNHWISPAQNEKYLLFVGPQFVWSTRSTWVPRSVSAAASFASQR